MADEGRTPMGSEPRSDRYQPVLENGQWLVVDTSRKAGPSGAAFPVVMTARFMAEAEVEACALNAAHEHGKAEGVREERDACLAICADVAIHEYTAGRAVELINAREAAQPPKQGDGKGGA